jgi:DNA-binding XRE family transcriptional regulator
MSHTTAVPYVSREVAELDWGKDTLATYRGLGSVLGSNTSPSTKNAMRSRVYLSYQPDYSFFDLAIPYIEQEAVEDGSLQFLNTEAPTTPHEWGDYEKYVSTRWALVNGTSMATGQGVVTVRVPNISCGEKLRQMRSVMKLDVTEAAVSLGISRPTLYRIEEGGEPKSADLRKKINKLYHLSLKIRAGYSAGPCSAAEITEWLTTCFEQMDRKAIANKIQSGRTTYGGHPTDPTKLVRINPDGTRDVGVWADNGFIPDAT